MPRSSTQTRDTIMTAAFRLFFRFGYTRVGMDDIAQAANVSKRTLYNHFDSKDTLIGAVLRQQDSLSLSEIQQWANSEAKTGGAFLDGLVEKLADWADTPGWTGSGFTRLTLELADLPGHPVRNAAHRHKTALRQWLIGELRIRGASNPEGDADMFCLLLEGAMVLALIHQDGRYITQMRNMVIRLGMGSPLPHTNSKTRRTGSAANPD